MFKREQRKEILMKEYIINLMKEKYFESNRAQVTIDDVTPKLDRLLDVLALKYESKRLNTKLALSMSTLLMCVGSLVIYYIFKMIFEMGDGGIFLYVLYGFTAVSLVVTLFYIYLINKFIRDTRDTYHDDIDNFNDVSLENKEILKELLLLIEVTSSSEIEETYDNMLDWYNGRNTEQLIEMIDIFNKQMNILKILDNTEDHLLTNMDEGQLDSKPKRKSKIKNRRNYRNYINRR